MEDGKTLKTVYAFFVGLLLAIFVGVGVSAFYQPPKFPEYPKSLNYTGKELTSEEKKVQQGFDQKMDAYDKQSKHYHRNVSIITMASAVFFLAVSLIFDKRLRVIADGILLGGIFTLIYSIGNSFNAADSKYNFAAVTIGLVIAITLGYARFIRPREAVHKK